MLMLQTKLLTQQQLLAVDQNCKSPTTTVTVNMGHHLLDPTQLKNIEMPNQP